VNLLTATAADLEALARKGARYVAVAAYPYGRRQEGDVLSWHRSADGVRKRYRYSPRVRAVNVRIAIIKATLGVAQEA
jgi:hypothetical protein